MLEPVAGGVSAPASDILLECGGRESVECGVQEMEEFGVEEERVA
jgi:hypothetical protein